MNNLAIVTGMGGQDATLLAELLLSNGTSVLGVSRSKSSKQKAENYLGTPGGLNIVVGDITNEDLVKNIISQAKPKYYFNLAAKTHVANSANSEYDTIYINSAGPYIALENIKEHSPNTKFFNASSMEIFGDTKCPENGYSEYSDKKPNTIYGQSKLMALTTTSLFRENGIFACSGILSNHTSSLRPESFIERKITKELTKIIKSDQKKIKMGNMSAIRDFGHAKDFIKAMLLMLESEKPSDYIISTGIGHSIWQIADTAAKKLGLNIEEIYEKDPRFMRTADMPVSIGDNTKIKSELGWEPNLNIDQIIDELIELDLFSYHI